MPEIRVYKEMSVAYGELETVLFKLGYQKSVGNEFILYFNKKFDSKVRIPKHSKPRDLMLKAHFLGTSLNLEAKGVIDHSDDLAKMIEAERLKTVLKAA